MEHEKSIIPAIITRCIQEVELRGMCFTPDLQLYSSNWVRYGHGRNLPQVRS
jgi:hypothetical protein